MITLLDGRKVDNSDLVFDRNTYRFVIGSTGEDVTKEITRRDKQSLVPGFDVEIENARISAEKSGGSREPLETNVWNIFGKQILDDPLAAPLETLDAGVEKIFDSKGIKTILTLGAVAVVAMLALKK